MTTIPRHPRAEGPLALCAALFLATACAGAGGAAGGAAAAGGGGAARATPASAQGGQFTPGRAAAERYGAGAAGACQSSTIINTVMAELGAAAKAAGRAEPQLDPRMCGVAEAFLAWDPAAGTPRPPVLAFVSHWFGMPVAAIPPTVATLATGDERLIAERIVQAVGNSAVNAVGPRIGIAVQRIRKGKDVSHKVSVALADAPIEVDALPRRLELGQQATLSGRLLGGVQNPKVFVSDATGQLSAPEQAPGDAFKADVRCGDRAGRILIEIRGEYEGSSGVVASFPVACGVPLEKSVAIAPAPWPSDPAAAEKRMLDLVNEDRTAAGLKPLTFDAALAKVARAISEDLAARGGAEGGASVTDRLRREGIAAPLVLQSAAAERSFERAHERLMSSPTNRANLLNPEVTNAGIGGVTRTDAEGRPLVYVTEVFIRELPPVDPAAVRKQLRDAVAQKRKDARTTPLQDDATLDEVAQRYAEALAEAGGSLEKERQTELTSSLNKGYRSVTMVSGAKPEPLDFAEEPQTTSPGRSLGVGVAQGRHPVLGRNATYVVLMVGTPRAAETPAAKTRKPRS